MDDGPEAQKMGERRRAVGRRGQVAGTAGGGITATNLPGAASSLKRESPPMFPATSTSSGYRR